GGGDTPEIEGIVDDRHEEVGGRHDALFIVERIDCRIVARGIAHPQAWIEMLRAAAGKNDLEHLGRDLAAAAGAMTVLGKTDGRIHNRYVPVKDHPYRNAAGLPKSNEISKPNCAPSDRRAGAVQPLKCQRSNALARSACRRLRSSGTVRGNSAGLTIGQRTGLDHASGHRGDEL